MQWKCYYYVVNVDVVPPRFMLLQIEVSISRRAKYFRDNNCPLNIEMLCRTGLMRCCFIFARISFDFSGL